MRRGGRTGFVLSAAEIRNDILVPRYYDPEIDRRLAELSGTHHLTTIGELIDQGVLKLSQGNYVGKMHYGSGPLPYIRTSDITNWELRGSPKHGVAEEVYLAFAAKQDVREGDVLLVHEGTYLIGATCLLTKYDTRILFQHHLAKLRLAERESLQPALLMALLLAPVVQRQIRSKQLTADIIDSIVGRLQEVVLPMPATAELRRRLAEEAMRAFAGRAEARLRLSAVSRSLDRALKGGNPEALDPLLSASLDVDDSVVSFLGGRTGQSSFTVRASDVREDVLVPRYYDPSAEHDLQDLSETCELVRIGQLVHDGLVELKTGDEIGRLSYGTGDIPFVRTSDLGNWELKHDPKHSVSPDVYAEYEGRQDTRPNDILIVRDGTYLVGTSVIVQQRDLPLLFCGGMYKARSKQADDLDPYLLLALLNTAVARKQMRNKQFTRDVIDTLGHRILEVFLPIPKDPTLRRRIGEVFRSLIAERSELLQNIRQLGTAVEKASTANQD